MIISASRRTDLPAHYFPWLVNRLRAGFALVRNPMNPRQVSRVDLRPEAVDGLVLWTKDPRPMLNRLDALDGYAWYVQFTLTPYGRDVEPGLPDKEGVLEPAFMELSRRIGPERVIWRYDPVLLTGRYTREFHLRAFSGMAKRLAPYTKRCVISFLDYYKCMGKAAVELGVDWPSPAGQEGLARELAGIAESVGLQMEACAEPLDLEPYGIRRGHCIDAGLLERISGRPLVVGPDKNQRPRCGCAQSVDIGAYSCCPNGCRYCYANHSPAALKRNMAAHDPDSPLLIGQLGPEDKVTERKLPPAQMKLRL